MNWLLVGTYVLGMLVVLGYASYKLPEQLLLLDHLPVVGDKIDRRALAAMAAK